MAKFELDGDTVIYTDRSVGAWFDIDKQGWYPFRYFDNGNLDIDDEHMFLTPNAAHDMARLMFT